MNFNGMILVLMVTVSAIIIGVSAKIIAKRETEGQLEARSGYLPTAEKRPFCNAFTGCGKKRSFEAERAESDPWMQLTRRLVNDAKFYQLLHNRLNTNEMSGPVLPIGFEYVTARKKRSIPSK